MPIQGVSTFTEISFLPPPWPSPRTKLSDLKCIRWWLWRFPFSLASSSSACSVRYFAEFIMNFVLLARLPWFLISLLLGKDQVLWGNFWFMYSVSEWTELISTFFIEGIRWKLQDTQITRRMHGMRKKLNPDQMDCWLCSRPQEYCLLSASPVRDSWNWIPVGLLLNYRPFKLLEIPLTLFPRASLCRFFRSLPEVPNNNALSR